MGNHNMLGATPKQARNNTCARGGLQPRMRLPCAFFDAKYLFARAGRQRNTRGRMPADLQFYATQAKPYLIEKTLQKHCQ